MSGLAIIGIVLAALPLVVLVILLPFFVTLGVTEAAARIGAWLAEVTGVFGLPGRLAAVVLGMPKFAVMMFKSLRRNLVRTSLTYLATFTGVIVVAMIWSV